MFTAAAVLSISTAQGAFIDTFDGTSLDSSTWIPYSYNAAITQNGQLQINAYNNNAGGAADYTTRSISVGVGGFVQADVLITNRMLTQQPYSNADEVWVGLTNDSGGTTQTAVFDSYHIDTSAEFSSTFGALGFFAEYSANGRGSGTGVGGSPAVGQPYQLRLERLSSTSIRSVVSNIDGSNRQSVVYTVDANTAPLMVSLLANNVQATFDNVIIGSVPEPTVLGLLSCVAWTCTARRRRT